MPENYRTPRVLFRNLGNGRFEQLTEGCGPEIQSLHSSRGCAFGDFDNDGDLDIVTVNHNEPPSLLRNDLRSGGNWIKVKLTGVQSNRSAIGARVTVAYGEQVQTQELVGQSSYLSVNDSRLHFGLGTATTASITIRWRSGKTEQFERVDSNRLLYVTETRGITSVQTFGTPR